jgi:hypothetical protein
MAIFSPGQLTVACVACLSLGLSTAAMAHAESIDDMVHTTAALESPFWGYLYGNGFGYLDADRAFADGTAACEDRKAGIPPPEVMASLRVRGYTAEEAKAIVLAELDASDSRAHYVC